jgi:hypothetical protein
LADEQFGFRTNSSMDMALYKLINDILMSIKNKLLVEGFFCDLEKAFDCVDHDLLLSKIHWYGISGKGHNLIQSYFKNIYQRVIIVNKSRQYYSEWEPIRYGVPQGSILGPLFFILYINDLPKTMAISASPVLFADNTSMFITKSDPMEFANTINRNIKKINNWLKSNALSLNIDKTHFFQFHTKLNQNYDPQISYENKQITKAQNIKFLEIIIESNLSRKQHIDDIISELNKACFAIRSIKPFMSLEAMRLIYFSYFHSVLSYGIIFWGNSVHSKFIFKIQKRTIRVITDSWIRDSCRDLFKKLQILPLYSQYIYSLCMFAVKNRDLFELNSDICKISTKYNNDFHLPSVQLKLFQKVVFYSGIKTYNHLSLTIKELSYDVKQFRWVLKRFIQSNSFYSLEEYFDFNWKWLMFCLL